METELDAFDNKMHPTKLVEKNWVDSYKLAQLIEQQNKRLTDQMKLTLFEGVNPLKLESAFAPARCHSSAGFKSPKGANTASRGSIMNANRQLTEQYSTVQGPLSSQRIDLSSMHEGV